MLGLPQAFRQRDAADCAAALVVLPARADQVAAHHGLDRQRLETARDDAAALCLRPFSRIRQHVGQLLREKKLMITINKRIASEDSLVHDGDALKLVAHDGMGGTGLAPM